MLFLCTGLTVAQAQVIINEVSSNNQSYYPDEEGKYRDWIELYNAGTSPLNLLNYKLSDSTGWIDRWSFPDVTIPAMGYLTVFASGKNRSLLINHWESIVKEGDVWRYTLPSAAISDWTLPGFDDSKWSSGKGGIGYGDGDDSTIVASGTVTLYMRRTFTVVDTAAIMAAILNMDCDDGFVAYLNGVEIARNSVNGTPPAYNATATSDNEAVMYSGSVPPAYDVTSLIKSLLKNGTNVLAIEVHNISGSSSDLSARPFLHVGVASSTGSYQPVPSWFTPPLLSAYIHTNFSIGSKKGEPLTLADPSRNIISSVVVPASLPDVSYGTFPNGSSTYAVLTPPTPNASNGSSQAFTGYLNATVSFSLPPGFYSGTQTVSCTCSDPSAKILYTTNGDKPVNGGKIYSGPIAVSSTQVLRTMCYKPGYLSSGIETNTYFISDPGTTLPVFSISTRPNNFFSQDSGIYVLGNSYDGNPPHHGANFWQDWEREVHFEYFDKTGAFKLEQDCGVKIFGGFSRDNPMKSMRLIPDAKYGKSTVQYPFFTEKPNLNQFTGLNLRDGGTDFNFAHLRDQTNHRVLQSQQPVLGNKTNIDFSAYEPVLVFINGAYWGVHHLRERFSSSYFEGNHGVSNYELLEFDGDVVKAQNNAEFLNLADFIQSNDMTQAANYNQVKSLLDIENYADLFIVETYHTNWDFPHNNIKYWKPTGSGKWRYLYYDTDFAFNLYNFTAPSTNELADVIEPGSSRNSLRLGNIHSPMLKKMLTNTTFRNYFINRYADLINTIFEPGNYTSVFNGLKSEISPEMARHFSKWNQNSGDVNGWNSNCDGIVSWMKDRPAYARNHVQSQFSLVKQVNVTLNVNPAGAGLIKISTITPTSLPWTGVYFDGVPVSLTVIPNPGYTFANWTSSALTLADATNDTITLNISANNTFTANFVKTTNIPKITFSEINYNSDSAFNPGDWVELYNYGTAPQDLSGWTFKDAEDYHTFTFPYGTVLGAGKRLVLVRDVNAFKASYPNVTNFTGPLDFDLSNSGEIIRLFDPIGRLYVSVTYNNKAPWPVYADGKGSTLELKDSTQSLNDPSNWFDGCRGGSPGTAYIPCPCSNVELGPDKILCTLGGTYVLNTGLTPHPNRVFTWYYNGVKITGISTPTLKVSSGGDYYVVVDSSGCIKSDRIHLTSDLSFSLGPDITLCDPITATFDSRLQASGISYEWRKNNTVIAGEIKPALTVSSLGTYTLVASASGCSPKSDTVQVSSSAATPTDGSRCGPGTVTLSVSGPGSYDWYTTATGGTAVASKTSTFTTPSISATTTYYVKDASFFNGTVGPANLNTQGGNIWQDNNWNNGYKMLFDVLQPLYLDAVTVYTLAPNQSITVRVLLPDKTTVKFSKTFTAPATGENRIPLGFHFLSADVKNGYYMDFVGTTGQLQYNGDGATAGFPYTAAGYLRITGTTASWGTPNASWYFYGYKWEYSSGPGPCQRVPVTAKVNDIPGAAGGITGAISACSGTSSTYSIDPVPNATAYSWTVPSGTIINSGSGTNAITVTLGSVSGDITVTPSSPCGNGTGSKLSVAISPAGAAAGVKISASATSVCLGQTITLTSVPSNGGTPSYQWQKNGVSIPGANSSVYTTSSAQNGDLFTVVMTSSLACTVGSPVTSQPVTIAASAPVTASVTVSASATSVCSGSSVTFTAIPANGGQAPVYQWKKNGAAISGATAATYSTASLANGDIISVDMRPDIPCPVQTPVSSNSITMTVNVTSQASVSISESKNNICPGEAVTFTAAAANGGTSPVFEWKINGTSAAKSGSTTFTSSAFAQGDVITAIMTSSLSCASGSPAASNGVTMTVKPSVKPSVTASASASTVCAGQQVTFTALPVDGGTSPVYQWKVNGSPVAGANTSVYTSSSLGNGDAVSVSMTSNADCSTGTPVAAAPIVLTVNPVLAASVKVNASATTVCAGTSITFKAQAANGGFSPAYQWVKNGTNITGATDSVYTSASLTSGDNISVVLTSSLACASGSPASSGLVTITVNPMIVPGLSIASNVSTICAGQSVNFTATSVNGGNNPSFQWKINGGIVTGAASSSFTSSVLSDGDQVTAVMTPDVACPTKATVQSDTLKISVNPTVAASVTIAADKTQICSGQMVTFTAAPVHPGNNPVYQWKVNNISINGSNASVYAASNFSDGDVVSAVLTSDAACVTGSPAVSNTVTLSVKPVKTTSVSISAGAMQICSGQAVTFTADAVNGGSNPLYVWRVNGKDGGSAATYTSSSLQDGDTLTVTLTSDEVCVTGSPAVSDPLIITVDPVVHASVSISASSTAICEGQEVTFLATPVQGGTSPVYYWKINGNAVAGATTSSFITRNLASGDAVVATMVSSAACAGTAPVSSDPVSVIVKPNPAAVISYSGSPALCKGSTLLLTAGQGSGLAYQWKKDSIEIPAATASAYSADASGSYTVDVTAGGCTATSAPVAVTVTDPVIAAAGADQLVCSGNAVLAGNTPAAPGNGLWVLVSGSGQFSDIHDPHATVTGVGAGINTYEWRIDNGPCGISADQVAVSLTNTAAAGVSIQADHNPVCAGTNVIFTALPVNGGGNPMYQWKVNGNNTGTNSNAFSSATLSDGDKISVTLTSGLSCVTGSPVESSPVIMKVNPTGVASVTLTSDISTVCAGQPVTFTAAPVNQGASAVYQWRINGAAVAQSAGPVFTTSSLKDKDTVTVLMTSSASCISGSPAISNPVPVTVNPTGTVSVSISADAATICPGQVVTFTATPINGGAMPSYQWMVNNTPVSGATSATYKSTSLDNRDVVSVTLTSSSPCVTSAAATSNTVRINVSSSPATSVNISAAAVEICSGQQVTFNALPVNGGSTPSYQWKRNGQPISGATSDVYTGSGLSDGDTIAVLMNSSLACATGSPAMSSPLIMKVHPSSTASVSVLAGNTSICSGQPVTFTALSVSGGNNPGFQWKVNDIAVAGATSSVFTSTGFGNNDKISVIMTVNDGTCITGSPASSAPVTLTVNPSLDASLHIQASAASICPGGTVVFTATPASGINDATYIWKVNGNTVTGENTATFTSNGLKDKDVITAVLESAQACVKGSPVTSNPVSITVNPAVTASVTISGADSVCAGSDAVFTALAVNGGDNPSYQWKVNGLNAGNNSAGFTTSALSSGDTVQVIMTSAMSCVAMPAVTSNAIAVRVDQVPTAADAGPDQDILTNVTTLQGNTPSIGKGIWTQTSGSGFIASAINPGTNVGGLADGTNVFRWTITNGSCPASSDDITVTVGKVQPFVITGPDTIKTGVSQEFHVPYEANATYIWTVPSGVSIINGNGTNSVTLVFGKDVSGTIYVTKISASGSVTTSEFVSTVVSAVIASTQAEGYSFYPNPFVRESMLMIPYGFRTKVTIRIVDMRGSTVFESDEHYTNDPIFLGKPLSTGMYNVTASFGDSLLQFRMVKTE